MAMFEAASPSGSAPVSLYLLEKIKRKGRMGTTQGPLTSWIEISGKILALFDALHRFFLVNFPCGFTPTKRPPHVMKNCAKIGGNTVFFRLVGAFFSEPP